MEPSADFMRAYFMREEVAPEEGGGIRLAGVSHREGSREGLNRSSVIHTTSR